MYDALRKGWGKMKFSQFNSIVEKDNTYIVHNTLYNTAIKVTDDNFKKRVAYYKDNEEFPILNDDFDHTLQNLHMVLNENINEINILNLKYREFCQSDTLEIIAFVTRYCNFRCPYCYEEHETGKRMEDETYDAMFAFIKEKISSDKYSRLSMGWFGGEPMLEYEKICSFMERLQVEFGDTVIILGQMTTNGYLLSPDKFAHLLKCNVNRYQITVDGIAETHNKTRIWDTKIGTWQRIIDNLLAMKQVDENFDITIRTNFTEEIYAHKDEWLSFLSNHFKNDSRFTFYCEAVKNLGKDSAFAEFNNISHSEIEKGMMMCAKDNGMNMSFLQRRLKPFSWICYAGKLNSFAIDYNGDILKCTVALDDEKNMVGKLKSGEPAQLDENNLSWWTTYDSNEACLKCPIYPLCYARKCPNVYYNSKSCEGLLELYKNSLLVAY